MNKIAVVSTLAIMIVLTILSAPFVYNIITGEFNVVNATATVWYAVLMISLFMHLRVKLKEETMTIENNELDAITST